MATFIYDVGATDRTYTTLAAAWAALPSVVPAGDVYNITLKNGNYVDGLDCNAVPKTITGEVNIFPEAGAAWYEHAMPVTRYDANKGVSISGLPFGRSVMRLVSGVKIQGLQIKGGGSNHVYSTSGTALRMGIERCILFSEAGGGRCIGTAAGWQGTVANNILCKGQDLI